MAIYLIRSWVIHDLMSLLHFIPSFIAVWFAPCPFIDSSFSQVFNCCWKIIVLLKFIFSLAWLHFFKLSPAPWNAAINLALYIFLQATLQVNVSVSLITWTFRTINMSQLLQLQLIGTPSGGDIFAWPPVSFKKMWKCTIKVNEVSIVVFPIDVDNPEFDAFDWQSNRKLKWFIFFFSLHISPYSVFIHTLYLLPTGKSTTGGS